MDAFDEMADMEWRFREHFLRQLEGPVLVVLSGRRITSLLDLAPGWEAVVEDMALVELTGDEARACLAAHGVTDAEAADHIVHLGRGNPLALAIAADLWVRLGVRDFVADAPGPVTQSLLRRLTSEIRDEDAGRLLEAAAVVRTFDQDLMIAMLGDVGSRSFARFCELSLVRSGPGTRFQLHDLVRRMVIADLHRRRPHWYGQLRRHAYLHLVRTAGEAPGPPYEVPLELMFLSEEALVHAAFFDAPAERVPELRPVLPEEHDHVRELAVAWAARLPDVDLAALHEQLELFLRLAPERFRFALDEAGTPVGFCNVLPLNRATMPAVERLWSFHFESMDQRERWSYRNVPEGDCSAGLVIGFVVPSPDRPEVRTALLRDSILRAALQTGRVIAITPHEEYKRLLERLGFEATGAGRHLYSSTLRHDVFVLDLSELGFEGWIQRLLGIRSPQAADGRLSGALVSLVSQPLPSAAQRLSPRERELLAALAAGLGNKQIARRYSISQNTVRNHLTNIYRKLDVPDRSHAILYAIRERLVEVT